MSNFNGHSSWEDSALADVENDSDSNGDEDKFTDDDEEFEELPTKRSHLSMVISTKIERRPRYNRHVSRPSLPYDTSESESEIERATESEMEDEEFKELERLQYSTRIDHPPPLEQPHDHGSESEGETDQDKFTDEESEEVEHLHYSTRIDHPPRSNHMANFPPYETESENETDRERVTEDEESEELERLHYSTRIDHPPPLQNSLRFPANANKIVIETDNGRSTEDEFEEPPTRPPPLTNIRRSYSTRLIDTPKSKMLPAASLQRCSSAGDQKQVGRDIVDDDVFSDDDTSYSRAKKRSESMRRWRENMNEEETFKDDEVIGNGVFKYRGDPTKFSSTARMNDNDYAIDKRSGNRTNAGGKFSPPKEGVYAKSSKEPFAKARGSYTKETEGPSPSIFAGEANAGETASGERGELFAEGRAKSHRDIFTKEKGNRNYQSDKGKYSAEKRALSVERARSQQNIFAKEKGNRNYQNDKGKYTVERRAPSVERARSRQNIFAEEEDKINPERNQSMYEESWFKEKAKYEKPDLETYSVSKRNSGDHTKPYKDTLAKEKPKYSVEKRGGGDTDSVRSHRDALSKQRMALSKSSLGCRSTDSKSENMKIAAREKITQFGGKNRTDQEKAAGHPDEEDHVNGDTKSPRHLRDNNDEFADEFNDDTKQLSRKGSNENEESFATVESIEITGPGAYAIREKGQMSASFQDSNQLSKSSDDGKKSDFLVPELEYPPSAQHDSTLVTAGYDQLVVASVVEEEDEKSFIAPIPVAIAKKDNFQTLLLNDRRTQLGVCLLICLVVGLTLGLIMSNNKAIIDDHPLSDQQTWMMMGPTISGDEFRGEFGSSVMMTYNGARVAIGAPGSKSSAGLVRVYEMQDGDWTLLGGDVMGNKAADRAGASIAISRQDGMILAVGSPGFPVFETEVTVGNRGRVISPSGEVNVYEYISGQWGLLGDTIKGQGAGDNTGASVSLSGDGKFLAVGSPGHDGEGEDMGRVQVFHLEYGNWTQFGGDINGVIDGDRCGTSVSLSQNGNRIAVGAVAGSTLENWDNAVLRVFQFSEGEWNQLGRSIYGQAGSFTTAWSTSISANGTRVAIGGYNLAERTSGIDNSLNVKIYAYDNNTRDWKQLGDDILGDYPNSAGFKVDLNADGNIVTVGDPGDDSNGKVSGHVHTFRFYDGNWKRNAVRLSGAASGDGFGASVSSSGDGACVVAGSPYNREQGFEHGHVRIFGPAHNDCE